MLKDRLLVVREQIAEVDHFILDIDLDFFSTLNPFVTLYRLRLNPHHLFPEDQMKANSVLTRPHAVRPACTISCGRSTPSPAACRPTWSPGRGRAGRPSWATSAGCSWTSSQGNND